MPAQFYCPGPIFLYAYLLRSSASSNYQFVGTCEDGPRVRFRRSYEDVRNTLGGAEPMDQTYRGRSAFLSFDLNRYDEGVVRQIQATINANPTTIGTENFGDIGTLVGQEGASISLILTFPYSIKPAMALPGSALPAGYRFPRCVLLDDDLGPLGTVARKITLPFMAFRTYNPTNGSFFLYDNTIPALPAVT